MPCSTHMRRSIYASSVFALEYELSQGIKAAFVWMIFLIETA